jgi:hypothetical protein
MSQRLISRSHDLARLQDDGYELTIKSGYLIINHVPYVNANMEISYGALVSELELSDDATVRPTNHVVTFSGETPCDANGQPLIKLINSSSRQVLADGIEVDHTLSSKPADGYADYYHKMSTYVNMISRPARSIEPDVTATTFPVITDDDDESVFNYIDTASSRARIGLVTDKLRFGQVAIVGLGGTGSYVLDLVAKTPVREIHLFDGDRFLQHNAFRSPGAPSGDELAQTPQKVAHFGERYSAMRRNIVPHDYYVDETNVEELRGMDFVFLALDNGDAKKPIVAKLEEFSVPFIDVGMGVLEVDGSLSGLLRVTTSTPEQRDHVRAKKRIPFSDGDANNDYSQNIQIADLNALNAALAVVKWKKLAGFYLDLEREYHCLYAINGNTLINEDQA